MDEDDDTHNINDTTGIKVTNRGQWMDERKMECTK